MAKLNREGGDQTEATEEITYHADPWAEMAAVTYEGTVHPPEYYEKRGIPSAAKMAAAMERSMTVGGTRADQEENQSHSAWER